MYSAVEMLCIILNLLFAVIGRHLLLTFAALGRHRGDNLIGATLWCRPIVLSFSLAIFQPNFLAGHLSWEEIS